MKRKRKQGKDLHLEYLSMEQTPKNKRKKTIRKESYVIFFLNNIVYL